LRVHGGGRRLEAAIQVSDASGGPRTGLKIEFVRSTRCPALPTPWTFSKRAAKFYR
jgi:hypothetical protein